MSDSAGYQPTPDDLRMIARNIPLAMGNHPMATQLADVIQGAADRIEQGTPTGQDREILSRIQQQVDRDQQWRLEVDALNDMYYADGGDK